MTVQSRTPLLAGCRDHTCIFNEYASFGGGGQCADEFARGLLTRPGLSKMTSWNIAGLPAIGC